MYKFTAPAGWVVAAAFGLLLCLADAMAGKQTVTGLSKEASESAAAKFRRIQGGSEQNGAFGSVRFSESELNSYAHYEMEPVFPPGFSKVRLRLQAGRPSGTAELDFDTLKGNMKNPPHPLIGYFLRGVHTLGVEGTLSGSNGVGQFHLEKVTLDDLTLPEPLVEFLIDHYLKAHYPTVAIDRPFSLPFSIDKLVVESGSVVLTSK